MKIAIHHNDLAFSRRWIDYCEKESLDYLIVDAFNSSIIEELRGVDIFLWHWNHAEPSSFLFARQLILSIEKLGVKVFPDVNTSWHYDDKIGQKYLLEAIEAPLVPSYVFYSKRDAIAWISSIDFPKVFKLRGGYGSNNVKLVKTHKEAKKLISRAFGKGFSQMDRISLLKNRIWKYRNDSSKKNFIGIIKGFGRLFINKEIDMIFGRERGYVYFQDFQSKNNYDTRLIVIGGKCVGIRRYNRENDFRASGSGLLEYNPELFDKKMISIAFEIAQKLNAQSIAYDFVYDENGNPKIVEISYCFSISAYDKCPGYWRKDLVWVKENIILQEEIIKSLLG